VGRERWRGAADGGAPNPVVIHVSCDGTRRGRGGGNTAAATAPSTPSSSAALGGGGDEEAGGAAATMAVGEVGKCRRRWGGGGSCDWIQSGRGKEGCVLR
jgi:hypothetical protein